MKKTKAMFATTAVMALLSAVIFFTWKFGSGIGFTIIEAVFALYGFVSLADDFCRWLQMPDTEILQKSGRR